MGERLPLVLSPIRPAAFPTSKRDAEKIGPIVSKAAAALSAVTQLGGEALSAIAAYANAAQPEPG